MKEKDSFWALLVRKTAAPRWSIEIDVEEYLGLDARCIISRKPAMASRTFVFVNWNAETNQGSSTS